MDKVDREPDGTTIHTDRQSSRTRDPIGQAIHTDKVDCGPDGTAIHMNLRSTRTSDPFGQSETVPKGTAIHMDKVDRESSDPNDKENVLPNGHTEVDPSGKVYRKPVGQVDQVNQDYESPYVS